VSATSEIPLVNVAAPDGHVLVAAVARPPGSGPFPVVVVLHGSEGFRPHYLDLAKKLADGGFIALAGAWFSGSQSGTGRSFQDVIPCPRCPEFQGAVPPALKYVSALVDAARKLPDVRADRVGLFGHSAGAAMAVLSASTGVGAQALVASGAGYTRGGRGGTPLIQLARDVAAPILILHGTADDQASVEGAREYERALRDLGKIVEVEYLEGAPHAMTFRPETAARIQERAIAFYRAHLLGTGTPVASGAPVASPRVAAAPEPSTRLSGSSYTGSLFDAHAHLIRSAMPSRAGGPPAPGAGPPGAVRGPMRGPGSPSAGGKAQGGEIAPQELVDRLRAAGVSGAFLFGAPSMMQRRNQEWVYAFVAVPHDPSKKGPVFNDEKAGWIEQQVRTEGARGIGELPLRHRPTGNAHAADAPAVLKIYDVAARLNVPVTVHVEHEYSRELERAVAHNRRAIIIWAHVGSGPPSLARELMRRHPNLYADISTRNPIFKMGIPVEQNSISASDGRIKDEWRTLFEEFPDRFLLGLDINNAERLQVLDQLVAYYRSVLGQLAPATAEKIAFRNARRLVGLESP
jgi:dienelactone hydrolase/predicted TIM-barrel fold metal-dependent hydrolase